MSEHDVLANALAAGAALSRSKRVPLAISQDGLLAPIVPSQQPPVTTNNNPFGKTEASKIDLETIRTAEKANLMNEINRFNKVTPQAALGLDKNPAITPDYSAAIKTLSPEAQLQLAGNPGSVAALPKFNGLKPGLSMLNGDIVEQSVGPNGELKFSGGGASNQQAISDTKNPPSEAGLKSREFYKRRDAESVPTLAQAMATGKPTAYEWEARQNIIAGTKAAQASATMDIMKTQIEAAAKSGDARAKGLADVLKTLIENPAIMESAPDIAAQIQGYLNEAMIKPADLSNVSADKLRTGHSG